MKRKLKVGVIQFAPKSYDFNYNISKALDLGTQALESGAKIIVLPELFDSGYCVKDKNCALDFNNLKAATFKTFTKVAKQYKAYIIACSIEKSRSKKLYDTMYILNANGIVGKYRKIYLWNDENKRFSRGKKYPVFNLKIDDFKVKVGLQICYEIGFSEGARMLALQGAEIICYSAAFGKARSYAWDLASRARALENGAFILASNRSGSEIKDISKCNKNEKSQEKLKDSKNAKNTKDTQKSKNIESKESNNAQQSSSIKSNDKSSKKEDVKNDAKEEIYFAGHSKIINPKGEILKELKEEESFIIAEIDMSEVETQRKTIPYLKDLNLSLTQKMLKKIYLKSKKEKKWQRKF